jgi:hypothetical protein
VFVEVNERHVGLNRQPRARGRGQRLRLHRHEFGVHPATGRLIEAPAQRGLRKRRGQHARLAGLALHQGAVDHHVVQLERDLPLQLRGQCRVPLGLLRERKGHQTAGHVMHGNGDRRGRAPQFERSEDSRAILVSPGDARRADRFDLGALEPRVHHRGRNERSPDVEPDSAHG